MIAANAAPDAQAAAPGARTTDVALAAPGRDAMGDKGKKDKDKAQKQKSTKQAQTGQKQNGKK